MTQCSQSAAPLYEQFLQVQQIGFVTLGPLCHDPYAMRRGGCLELYYCNMVSGSGGIQAQSRRPTGFLQCFDTGGLVIWPVKIVPEMTYYVLSGTLNTNQPSWSMCVILAPSETGKNTLLKRIIHYIAFLQLCLYTTS